MLGRGSAPNAPRITIVGIVAMWIVLGQFLSKLLFGVTPFDVPTLVMVATVLGVATVTASWLPARGHAAGPGGGDSAGLTSA